MNLRNMMLVLPSAILLAMLVLFTGVEKVSVDHEVGYLIFAKQEPTLQFVFSNPAACGECDVRPLGSLTEQDREVFARFCEIRFGLTDTRQCHAIFAEAQRMADERMSYIRQGNGNRAATSK